ncbi:MAG: exodeoxyribonuclease VII large subunit, partial [Marinomonas sp.]
SPHMLSRSVQDARAKLNNARLVPQLVTRPMLQQREKLDALARLASQFHPEKPLERGYAIVRDSAGAAVTSRKAAAEHAALGLQFADGTLEVGAGSGAKDQARHPPQNEAKRGQTRQAPSKTSVKSAPKRSKPAANPAQDDLFG